MEDDRIQRLDYAAASPGALKAMYGLSQYSRSTNLEHSLLALVEVRASQLNGCTWCLEMHTKEARAAGETEQRLYLVAAWREAHCFSDRERAALAWTEAVTLVAQDHIPSEVYEAARKGFDEKDLVDLTIAIITINGWNRLNVAFRSQVKDHTPRNLSRD